MLKSLGYLVWRLRVWRNRHRHRDLLLEERRGALDPHTVAAVMLMRDREKWRKQEKDYRKPCPDLWDYTARIPYRIVVRRRAERAADLDRIRAGGA